MDVMAEGKDGAIITYGGMVYRAMKIRENLAAKGGGHHRNKHALRE